VLTNRNVAPLADVCMEVRKTRVLLLVLGLVVAIAGFGLLGYGIQAAQVPLVQGPPQTAYVSAGIILSDVGFALIGAGV